MNHGDLKFMYDLIGRHDKISNEKFNIKLNRNNRLRMEFTNMVQSEYMYNKLLKGRVYFVVC